MELYFWLKSEWIYNNHKKYHKYFEKWFNNLTDGQITGFEKMKNANYKIN